MLKKTMLVFALMALLVGTLLAQPMRVEGNDDFGYGRRNNAAQDNRTMGENGHHRAARGPEMMSNREKGHNKGMNPGGMILAMSEELGLNATQIDEINEILASSKKVLNTKHAEVENLLIDKRDAMMKQDFKKAKQVTKNISDKREEISLAKITTMEDIYKKLSKEQIALLKTKCKMK